MRKFLVLLVVAIVLLAAAYVAGYWPQRALKSEQAQLQQRLDAAEAKVRAGQLLGELLTLKETVQEMNYGQARGLSSPFFDRVRAEASRTADPGLKQALDGIQQLRDRVTVGLTQGDPYVLSHLREAERRLRLALGYPAPAATVAPLPAPTTPALPGTATVPPAASPTPPPASPAPTTAPPTGNPLGVPTPTPVP